MALTLTDVQRELLDIIRDVEEGNRTPESAVRELESLKSRATTAGLKFRADYSLEDFQKIATAAASTYDSSSSYVKPEPSYESSY